MKQRQIDTHLFIQEPLKSRNTLGKSKRFCIRGWPCKTMSCEKCYKRRRRYFTRRGYLHCKENDLSQFTTISWVGLNYKADPWHVLSLNYRTLSKKCSGMKLGHYIRTIAVGEQNTPHVHIIHHKRSEEKLKRICKKQWNKDCLVHSKPVTSAIKLLGYFFDQNFKLSALDPNRPKRLRVLSASRPMSVAFPTGRKEKELWDQFKPKAGGTHE